MKRKELWLFLLKVVVLTVVLGYVWFARFQTSYPDLIEPLATPIFALAGVRQWWLMLLIEHFTSLVPYVALALSTPGLIANWKRSLAALAGGVAIIVVGHLLMSIAVYHIMDNFAASRTSYVLVVPVYLVNDALPLVLWLLFFGPFVSRLLRAARGKQS